MKNTLKRVLEGEEVLEIIMEEDSEFNDKTVAASDTPPVDAPSFKDDEENDEESDKNREKETDVSIEKKEDEKDGEETNQEDNPQEDEE